MYRIETFYIVFGLLALLLFGSAIYPMLVNNNIENFTNLGKYPDSVDKIILSDTYNVNKHAGLSTNCASNIYKNYPVFPATSVYNNNIRFWRKPTNGKCTPPDICGGLYDYTEQPIPKVPSQPKWDNGIRVNYYESSRGCV